MFKFIRIQVIHPCRAKCEWCSTHRKNPIFERLSNDGVRDSFHQTYLEIIEKYQPKEVFISGGEPLLSPDIEPLLSEIAKHTQTIHVFTSYQFSRRVMDKIARFKFPEQVVLNHTPIYFEPERWHKLTQGFPFDVYIDNVRRAALMPVRKRFKFIVNHKLFAEEIARFREYITPNESCEVSLKLMNDQGDGQVVDTMQRSTERVHERLQDLDGLLADAGWTHKARPHSSIDWMKPVVESGDVSLCVYRREPIELRLSYAGGERGRSILKYRYCPYFPADVGHRFHLGRDPLSKLEKNYVKGPFRTHCNRCRLLHYTPPCESTTTQLDNPLVVLN